MADLFAQLQADADTRDVYQDLLALGQQCASDLDSGRWTLGDIACLVDTRYGENTITAFAKAINVSVDSVRSYRTVSRAFPRENKTRIEYEGSPVVCYSHFKQAARLLKYEDGDQKAAGFIGWVADNTATVEAAGVQLAKAIGKPTPPRKLVDVDACFDRAGVWLILRLPDDGKVHAGVEYRVKVYEGESK